MKSRRWPIIAAVAIASLFMTSTASAQQDEPGDFTLREVLLKRCRAALARRREAFEQMQTAEDVRRWVQQRSEFFRNQLGVWPECGPLHAEITGTLRGDGYRVEKVIFESQPHHHITANLYLPESSPPFPAVLVPCGHSYNGKAAEGYQRVSILLARHGIAAMCYDPIGQGERYQTFGPGGDPLTAEYAVNPNSLRQLQDIPGGPRFNPVEEHTLVGVGAILVGRNTATYRIFDGMRCIDYLVSRPDIDATRIGCTGNSGGGTLTAYLMALDPRIACAAPACYLTTFERLLNTNGPQDAEQNIFQQIEFGMDEADYVLMRAPRPTCLLAGTRDATFDILGTWDIFREAKRVYASLGHPERVELVEADAPHGFSVQLRIGAVRWMRRWLLGVDDAVTETDFPVWTAAELQCTERGQVMLLEGERSVFDLNRELEQQLARQRAEIWSNLEPQAARQLVRKATNIQELSMLPQLKGDVIETVVRDGYTIEHRLLRADGRWPLPALAFVPPRPTEAPFLYLHGEGKHVDAGADGRIEQLVRKGHLVLAVDLAKIGSASETAGEAPRSHWSRALFGADAESFWLAYLLGDSLVALRSEDALLTARYLAAEHDATQKVHVLGVGRGGLAALHAAAIHPELFASVTLRDTLTSWSDVVSAPLGHQHLSDTIHGVLRSYDLPDLVRLIGSDKITIEQPHRP